MTTPEKSSWNVDGLGPMTVEGVTALYSAAEQFRVAHHVYPALAVISGSLRECVCYVLRGDCAITIGEFSIALRGGEFATLPLGTFHLTAGEEGVDLVQVWDMSKLLNGPCSGSATLKRRE